jgi:hypothetical protein
MQIGLYKLQATRHGQVQKPRALALIASDLPEMPCRNNREVGKTPKDVSPPDQWSEKNTHCRTARG